MRRLDILRIAPFRALRNREPDIVLRPRRPDPLIAGMAREVAVDGLGAEHDHRQQRRTTVRLVEGSGGTAQGLSWRKQSSPAVGCARDHPLPPCGSGNPSHISNRIPTKAGPLHKTFVGWKWPMRVGVAAR